MLLHFRLEWSVLVTSQNTQNWKSTVLQLKFDDLSTEMRHKFYIFHLEWNVQWKHIPNLENVLECK